MRGIILSMAAMATRLGNMLDISFMALVALIGEGGIPAPDPTDPGPLGP